MEYFAGREDGSPRMLVASLAHEFAAFDVCCIHLDHSTEPRRLRQMAQLWHTLETSLVATGGRILAGDFNALRRADYTAEAWELVAAVRRTNSWENPSSRLMDSLRLGWADAWAAAAAADARGVYPLCTVSGGSLDSLATSTCGPFSTCRFDTRIDYVLVDAAFCASWRLVGCTHFPTEATDHALVVAEFEPARATPMVVAQSDMVRGRREDSDVMPYTPPYMDAPGDWAHASSACRGTDLGKVKVATCGGKGRGHTAGGRARRAPRVQQAVWLPEA